MLPGYWINSKPVYKSLEWEYLARSHIVLGQGAAGRSILRLYQLKPPQGAIKVLYVPAEGEDYTSSLQALMGSQLHVLEDAKALWYFFDQLLQYSTMGTKIYAVGNEQFLWEATTVAAKHGVMNADVMREQTDTLARSVYCVHCKTTTHNVKTNIAACVGCQRYLFVRDHFSRRLNAYMGLMVDAEEPGNVPTAEEIYP